MTIPTRGLLVFERTPFWGPELKRQFSDQQVLVVECRSVQDLSPRMGEFSECLVVLTLDAAVTDCLTWIGRQGQSDQRFPIIVIASSEYAELEWTIRESGVVAFLHDETCGRDLATICGRLIGAASRPAVAAVFSE